MWFVEQVVIICLTQVTMIPFTYTKPQTYLNNNNKGNNKHSLKNYLASVQEAKDFKNSDINSESILKAFNFPDVEYPMAATPHPQPYFQDFNENQSSKRNFKSDASNIKLRSDLKYARNGTFNYLQKFSKPIKANFNQPKDLSVLPKEFTSGSEFRNVGNFPEVEYPLSAKDTWKPNYWSIPSVSKDLNALISEDPDPNQNLAIYPTRNSGFSNKSGKCRSFSIKSYSDVRKNKELLKQVLENKANKTSNKQNNSTCRNDFIINGEENYTTNDTNTLPIENLQELYTTAVPYYFTPIDISPDCEEFHLDISNNSVFKSNKRNNNPHMLYQNALIPKQMETDNPYKDNKAFKFEEESTILLEQNGNDRKDISPDYIQEMNELYNIIKRPERPDTGTDFCGLDDDYTTDIYSEDQNTGWYSHPVTTPTPFSTTTVDLTWKNCEIIAPCELSVDELEDYYISV